ncbi:MAG: cytochrome P450, partial [Pseudomonadota bacterium]
MANTDRGHWLFGHARALAASPHSFVADRTRGGSGVAPFRMGPKRWFAVGAPEPARQVLTDPDHAYQRSFHYARAGAINGDGLIHVDGEPWRARRSQMLPLFRKDRMERLGQATLLAGQRLQDRWRDAAARGEPIDAVAEGRRLSLSVMSLALFSEEMSPGDADRLAALLERSLLLMRMRNTGALPLPDWMPTALNRQIRRARTALDGFVRPRISARRSASAMNGEAQTSRREGGEDMLDGLLAIRDGDRALTDEELEAEAKTLMSAGFETTAITFAWALWLLANHPEAQARAREEASAATADGPPSLQDLERLPFLKAVIDETLRLYPP